MAYANDHHSGRETISQINITPLVDVLLTVLIIFMIATPLVTKRIDLPLLPGPPDDKNVEPRVLTLAIRETGDLVLEGQSVSRLALEQNLRIAAASGAPLQLEISPEAHSSYDNLAQVLAIAQRNHVGNLRVMNTRPD